MTNICWDLCCSSRVGVPVCPHCLGAGNVGAVAGIVTSECQDWRSKRPPGLFCSVSVDFWLWQVEMSCHFIHNYLGDFCQVSAAVLLICCSG